MADRDTEALRKELDQAKENIVTTSKMLVRRDLALSRANEQLRMLDSAKTEFISVAAHQLRTPLSAVKWIMNMLVKDEFKSDEERMEFIQKASDSVDRMIALVNDLLQADHIQSGKEQFVFAPVDLASLVEAVVSDLSIQAKKKQQAITVSVAPGSIVMGDSSKLYGVLQNLLENSVKYTPECGTITVSTAVDEKFVTISVADTGIGIPKDQQIRLFSKFFRAQNAMRIDTTGSGLGLFIARQVVERHGGTLTLISEENKGSTFSVKLPRARVASAVA